MATLQQIEANRLNSRKSTGPRSIEGKAVTSMNALKTGIDAASHVIRGEDPQALEALTADYHREYQPATPQERALLDALVASEWLLRRLNKTEAQLWEFRFQADAESDCLDKNNPLGDIFSSNASTFSRLQRRIDSAGRAWQRAYNELERIRPQPAAPDLPSAPIRQPAASEPPSNPLAGEKPYPSIGFVPQPPPQAARPPLAVPPRAALNLSPAPTALHLRGPVVYSVPQ